MWGQLGECAHGDSCTLFLRTSEMRERFIQITASIEHLFGPMIMKQFVSLEFCKIAEFRCLGVVCGPWIHTHTVSGPRLD